ncbi:MAG: isoquinoline 1-oxidoreductase subunit alpha [Acidobacteriota bacterium]|jgi:aerobic-type carbon monoxide dehydrogenase small subunit (CoxS/CutS family)|nr:isoquinoline 1-oxidoreductase subunit alpha [Acidobacteriota bacterium]
MSVFQLNVNGNRHTVDVDGNMPLLWVLRDILGLTGTKFGCGVAQCGACTVHLDGRAARSCAIDVGVAAASEITTIEGLSYDGSHPCQKAWVELGVPQCGFCQPGQIMTAAALLAANPHPDDTQIDNAMRGNICRCGTYPRIRAAIHKAAGDATS